MKKPAIILLITLFFIISISILIMKNLNDSEKFIDESSLGNSLVQMQIINKNLDKEILGLIEKNRQREDVVDVILDMAATTIPFGYGNIYLEIDIEEYIPTSCDLNSINTIEELNTKCDQEILENILYQYDFIILLNEYKPIKNSKQLEFFINKYKNFTRDDKVSFINKELYFLNTGADNTKRYLKFDYDVLITNSNLKAKISFIYDVKEGKKIDFNMVLI